MIDFIYDNDCIEKVIIKIKIFIWYKINVNKIKKVYNYCNNTIYD